MIQEIMCLVFECVEVRAHGLIFFCVKNIPGSIPTSEKLIIKSVGSREKKVLAHLNLIGDSVRIKGD